MAQNDDNEMQDGESETSSLDLQSTLDTALEMVETQAREHPFRTLGIAMGVGYVLGGGLPKMLVRLGMLAAGRVLTDAITAEGLRTLAGNLPGGEDEETSATGRSRGHNGHNRKRSSARERRAQS